MKAVKYIIYCISDCFDAYVGGGSNGGIKETVVGLASFLCIILIYLASLSLLYKKTNISYRFVPLCSIGITSLLVGLIFLVLIIIE